MYEIYLKLLHMHTESYFKTFCVLPRQCDAFGLQLLRMHTVMFQKLIMDNVA